MYIIQNIFKTVYLIIMINYTPFALNEMIFAYDASFQYSYYTVYCAMLDLGIKT